MRDFFREWAFPLYCLVALLVIVGAVVLDVQVSDRRPAYVVCDKAGNGFVVKGKSATKLESCPFD